MFFFLFKNSDEWNLEKLFMFIVRNIMKQKQYPLEKNKEIMNGKEGGILYSGGLRAFVVVGTSLFFVEFAKQTARLVIAGLFGKRTANVIRVE